MFVQGGLGLELRSDGYGPMGINCSGPAAAKKIANAGFLKIEDFKLQVLRMRCFLHPAPHTSFVAA